MLQDLNYLFNEVPLYTKNEFKVFKLEKENYVYNTDEALNFLRFIGISQKKIITYCHLCKKEFPFDKKIKISHTDEDGNFTTVANFKIAHSEAPSKLPVNPYAFLANDGTIIGLQPPFKENTFINNQIWYIQYFFKCTNDSSHDYMMILAIELKDGSFIVRKIGQNPSMLTVKGFDFDVYKKQLKELNAYEDYKKANLSNANHFYVGAFAYLRRIFEKMINNYIKDIELDDSRMQTKIEACKSKFNPRIHNTLTNLYKILSKSIHELDEDESKEYYHYLKAVLDMQLEFVKTECKKQEQSRSLESTLNSIASKLK